MELDLEQLSAEIRMETARQDKEMAVEAGTAMLAILTIAVLAYVLDRVFNRFGS